MGENLCHEGTLVVMVNLTLYVALHLPKILSIQRGAAELHLYLHIVELTYLVNEAAQQL